MQRKISSLAASAFLLVLLSAAEPALAQVPSPVTFVSGNGNNASNCLTPATACREIEGDGAAFEKTATGGKIHVLPGDYLPFTLDRNVSIIADSGHASVTTFALNLSGIGFSAANILAGSGERFMIRGFTFAVGGHGGVGITGSGVVHFEDCTFQGGSGDFGVNYAPSGQGELYISDSSFEGAGGGGIKVRPTGSGSPKVVLDNINVEDSVEGILIDGRANTGSKTVTVRDGTISGSTSFGIFAVDDSSGGALDVLIEGSTFAGNGSFGVGANGGSVTVRMRDSTVNGNTNGLIAAATSEIISLGGNTAAGNTTNGAFSSTVAQQ